MKKLKILIVDDEPLAHSILINYCQKIDYVELVGSCYDGLSAINFLHQTPVDALLLDIQMPDLTGMELLDTLQNHAPKIIFTTAYTDYALQGFEYDQVVDYLHKPIRLTRFIKAMERLKKVCLLEQENKILEKEVSPIHDEFLNANFISLKDNKVVYQLAFEDILYVQSWGNYIKIFLQNESMKIIRKTIKEMEDELPRQLFERVHKSYLVNKRHVKQLEANSLFISDQRLPIGKSYQARAKEQLLGK